jgi:DinB family protein
MHHEMRHWIALWDYLDGNFWGCCRWFERELSAAQIGWQPVPSVASIGWNLQHLGEMLDHYLTHVFKARSRTLASEPLVTMQRDSQDDGRFHDLQEIKSYHLMLRPAYREFLGTLTDDDMDEPLSPRGAHSTAWAVGHIAEHESYHLGKCTLLRSLILARRGTA